MLAGPILSLPLLTSTLLIMAPVSLWVLGSRVMVPVILWVLGSRVMVPVIPSAPVCPPSTLTTQALTTVTAALNVDRSLDVCPP